MAENETRKNGAKKVLILVSLVVLGLLAAYGFGRWQGTQAVADVRTRAADYRQDAAAGAAEAQAELAELRSRVQMLQARRRLHLALMALDDRNFGTARDHLLTAGGDLAAVGTAPPGADPAALAQLAQELQSARLIATEDLSEQRRRVTRWVQQLDAQFPTEPAPVTSPETGAAEPAMPPGGPETGVTPAPPASTGSQ